MANMITPLNYPSSNRTPVVAFSLDNTNANTAQAPLRTLLIGQMQNTGTATVNVPVLVSNLRTVQGLTGTASMLSSMFASYVQDDGFAETWILPVADGGGAVAAINTMTVTGTATSTGTLSVYVAGTLVAVAVTTGDTATVIAAAFVTALGRVVVPVTATSSLGVATMTAVHKGIAAGDVDLRLNYLGAIAGEVTPTGITVAFATSTPGTVDPTLTTGLANLVQPYSFIVSPYSGSTQLGQLQTVLSDVNGTWSWLSNTGGGVFTAYKSTYASVQSYGLTNNLQHTSVLGISDCPTPVANIASSYAAVCANSIRNDPALPLTAIVMTSIQAPPVQSRYTRLQRNTLLYSGIATWKSNAASQVILERAVTTYQTNAAGVPDNSYLDVNTLYTLQAIIDAWKISLASKYARVKLVDNSTPIRPGTNTVNPNAIRAEVIAQYQNSADEGLVQDVPTFIANCTVQQVSPNQVNVYAPVNIATGLYQLVFDFAFLL